MNKQQFIDLLNKSDVTFSELGGSGVVFGCGEVKDEYELPEAFSIIFDHGMTAVTWADGTTTKTHCQGGDEFDPLFGIMACAVRKLTNNEGHAVDDCEGFLHDFADSIDEPDDIDALIGFYSLLLDVLTVLRESECVWGPQLEADEPPAAKKPESKKAVATTTNEVESEASVRERERVSQIVRRLIDMGEL